MSLLLITLVALAILAFAPGGLELPPPPWIKTLFNLQRVGAGSIPGRISVGQIIQETIFTAMPFMRTTVANSCWEESC